QVGKRSVWYKIKNEATTSPAARRNRIITVDTFPSLVPPTSGCPPQQPLDTLLAVYIGPDQANSFSQLQPLAFNDDYEENVDVYSRVIFLAPPTPQAYYIAVDGKNGSSGNFILRIMSEPAPEGFKNRVGQITEEELNAALQAEAKAKE
ncbi:MAG: hypothetical protein N2111_10765, partial [Candidatus Sumerlaeaceae bacterium]|nr:hypothetical protein [Candidatus Sumerlaeaceae bacterium]